MLDRLFDRLNSPGGNPGGILPQIGGKLVKDEPEKRGRLIKQLEDAMLLAEELNDGTTTYLIERALDDKGAVVLAAELPSETRRVSRSKT
jgi:hypothetical protein